MTKRAGLVILLALLGGAALADTPPPALPTRASLADRAARRFPQPVRAGDLVGRDVLQPVEAQPVLGRVEGVRRAADGGVDLAVRVGTVLGWGGRLVPVPIEAIALLGEYVALLDYTPAQLAALSGAPPQGAVPADETVRIGLVRPFH